MLIVKNIAKNIAFPIITGLGIEKLLSKKSKNNNLILCFHGVSNFKSNINKRHMPVAQFESLVIYLKNNFEIVNVRDIFINKNADKKRIAITFDDGYLNNYTVAFPILKKHNIPATLYITTESFEIKDYCLWPEIFDALKIITPTERIIFNNEEFKFANSTLINSRTNITIYDYVKAMGSERQNAFDEFITKYNIKQILKTVNPELVAFCNKEQIKEMSKSPLIEIGSHTHRHYNLSNINTELVREELQKSKLILESITGKPILSIGYPDGDYSDSVKNIAEEVGYKYQLAVTYKDEQDKNDNRIRSRYSISNSTSLNTNKILINKQFNNSGF
jgi:peptidoglycan/xylan/chitin deacetylase (PgdA/CDA1 family)